MYFKLLASKSQLWFSVIELFKTPWPESILTERPPLDCEVSDNLMRIEGVTWFDSRHYQIFWEVVGLQQDPLSVVSTTEELLGKKVESPVWKSENTAVAIRHADHMAPSIRKIWH
jgi:hypothetical protein